MIFWKDPFYINGIVDYQIVEFASTIFIGLLHWIDTYTHSPIGGIHGKIGFIFLVLTIGHTVKRMKFFKTKNDRSKSSRNHPCLRI